MAINPKKYVKPHRHAASDISGYDADIQSLRRAITDLQKRIS